MSRRLALTLKRLGTKFLTEGSVVGVAHCCGIDDDARGCMKIAMGY